MVLKYQQLLFNIPEGFPVHISLSKRAQDISIHKRCRRFHDVEHILMDQRRHRHIGLIENDAAKQCVGKQHQKSDYQHMRAELAYGMHSREKELAAILTVLQGRPEE